MEEIWEIDVEGITLNDLVALEDVQEARAAGKRVSMKVLRELLARFIEGKTPEDFGGELRLTQLYNYIDQVLAAVEEAVALPKSNDTPS